MTPSTHETLKLRGRSLFAAVAASAAMLFGADVRAADSKITVAEVAPPPAAAGTTASLLRDVAVAEIDRLDVSKLGVGQAVLVSLAVTKTNAAGPVACTVSATLRDAGTGNMFAVIEAGAHAEGPASLEVRKRVTHDAVRSAIRRIPRALAAR